MDLKRKKVQDQVIRSVRAALSMKVIPDGADKPLPPPLATVEIDPDDAGEIALWDALMPRYQGMLNAKVINKQRYDE